MVKISKKTELIKFRVTEDQKNFIQNKSKEYGFKSVSAFLISSAKNHFIIELDLFHFDKVAREINYIGNNINNLVHHIFTIGTYSKYDLKEIQRMQKELNNIINKEYDYLLKLRKKYQESNMTEKNKKRLIESLKNNNMEIPKGFLLEEIYENIRNNVIYICKLIEDSPEQEEGISEYVYEYLFDGILLDLDEDALMKFSNDIYFFTEKMRMKMINPVNVFDDDDWYDLKDILDEYENNY